MSPVSILLVVFAGVALLGVVLWGVFRVLMKRMRSVGEARLRERYPSGGVLLSAPSASCFGLESRGRMQVRGNGALALTANELWFRRFAGDFEVAIPLADITGVDLADSHLGKRVFGRQLLRVRFRAGGAEDVIAWLVSDPSKWLEELDRARRG
jgi:hypothetical protein